MQVIYNIYMLRNKKKRKSTFLWTIIYVYVLSFEGITLYCVLLLYGFEEIAYNLY